MFGDEKNLNEQNMAEDLGNENVDSQAEVSEEVVADKVEEEVCCSDSENIENVSADDDNMNDDFNVNTADDLNNQESSGSFDNQYQNVNPQQDNYYNNANGENNNYYDNYNNSNYGYNAYYNNQSDYNNFNPNNNKKKMPVAIIAALSVAAVVLVAGVSILSDRIADNTANKLTGNEETTVAEGKVEYPSIGSTNNAGDGTNTGFVITDVSDIVENCMPSIVSITSTTIVESTNFNDGWPFFGYGYDQGEKEYEEQVGAGSGFIVKQTDKELLVVTNNHVVTGADSLQIQFVNGTSVEGVIKSTDENADIAIVSIKLEDIDSDTMAALKIATLGSSDEIRVGEGVVAIGNALGYGQSVTTGIISAKEREISVDNHSMTVLQTDAAINGGNSGGALINSKGEVIGINVAKYSSSSYSGAASVEGMGFAIPISQATEIMNNLMDRETREKVDESERGVLGILGFTVDASVSEAYSIPQGIFIKEIVEGGAAEKAGLRATDIITELDGISILTMENMQEQLLYYKAGEKIALTVLRSSDSGHKEMKVEVTLSAANVIEDVTTENR